MATHKQLARIHILKQERQMDDDDYRDFLESRFGVRSSRALTEQQAFDAIEALGGESKEQYRERFNRDPGRRDGFATPKQLRKIEALWADVSYVKDDVRKQREAFDKFLYRRFKCWFRSIPQNKVGPIIKTLETMRDNRKGDGPDGAA